MQDDLSDVTTYASFLTNPTGGKDEYTLLELKDAIRKHIQTPDTIITDTDLKNKLSDILNLSSEQTYHKLRRNDPIERILDLYIIVKDNTTSTNSSIVVPTNTLDVEVDMDTIIDNKYNTIKPFFLVESAVVTDVHNNTSRVNKMIPTQRSQSALNMYYSSYYAIKINKNPLMCNFFNFNANYSLTYEKTYINSNASNEVYINNAIIERDMFSASNQYYMRITIDSINTKFLEDNTLIIKARFGTGSSDEDFILDFAKVINSDGTESSTEYEAKITSMDIISDSNELFIKNVYKMYQRYQDGTEDWKIDTQDYNTSISDSLDCEICIFFNYDTDEAITNKSFQNIRSVRKKLLLSTYTISDISFYKNVDEIIYCQVEESKDSNNTIIIKSLPLYKNEYVSNTVNKDVLNTQMTIEKNIKEKINSKTEFPSRLSLKYFNTYGYSQQYESLDNVSLYLKFEISYKNNKAISNSELESIKTDLINFIDTINKKSSTEDKNIYLSDLTQIVTNNSNITQCRILNFSDNIYYISNSSDDTSYVPASLQLESDNIEFIAKST